MNKEPQPRVSDSETGGLRPCKGAHITADPGSDYLISVQIEPRFDGHIDCEAMHRLALAVLREEKVPGPVELGVVITTDDEVSELNRQYLGHDYQTDVLSFGMEDEEAAPNGPFVTPAGRAPYLGDVVISYDRAAEQAPEYGQSTEAEVATLLIHGLLHLLGYDDAEDAERKRMHARQRELLEAYYGPKR